MTGPTRIPVNAERPYEVVVGTGLLGALAGMLGPEVARVAIIHPAALRTTAEAIRADLLDGGRTAILLETPDAEDAKTAQVAAFCWEVLGQAGFTRSDAIVGVGGGATTDLAGFWERLYPQVRRELSRRYPKHAWPENPHAKID